MAVILFIDDPYTIMGSAVGLINLMRRTFGQPWRAWNLENGGAIICEELKTH